MPRRCFGAWSIACLFLSTGFVYLSSSGSAAAPPAFDPAACQRPYTDDSPWNTPIVNPVYSPDNAAHIRAISTDGDARNPNTNLPANSPLSSDGTQYTFPIYYINNSTPRVTVKFETWFSDVQSPTVMQTTAFRARLCLQPEVAMSSRRGTRASLRASPCPMNAASPCVKGH